MASKIRICEDFGVEQILCHTFCHLEIVLGSVVSLLDSFRAISDFRHKF